MKRNYLDIHNIILQSLWRPKQKCINVEEKLKRKNTDEPERNTIKIQTK